MFRPRVHVTPMLLIILEHVSAVLLVFTLMQWHLVWAAFAYSALYNTDVNETRSLYDKLIPLCPILLALTVATPVFKGLLSDTDVRCGIISASVDDRTPEEKTSISKSRYDSVSLYLDSYEAAKN